MHEGAPATGTFHGTFLCFSLPSIAILLTVTANFIKTNPLGLFTRLLEMKQAKLGCCADENGLMADEKIADGC